MTVYGVVRYSVFFWQSSLQFPLRLLCPPTVLFCFFFLFFVPVCAWFQIYPPTNTHAPQRVVHTHTHSQVYSFPFPFFLLRITSPSGDPTTDKNLNEMSNDSTRGERKRETEPRCVLVLLLAGTLAGGSAKSRVKTRERVQQFKTLKRGMLIRTSASLSLSLLLRHSENESEAVCVCLPPDALPCLFPPHLRLTVFRRSISCQCRL